MIAVDWGTSSLRLYLLDANGNIQASKRSDEGIRVSAGRFAEVLQAHLHDWDDSRVVLGGMVGSRSAWFEVPYVVGCAGARELAASMQKLPPDTLPGRDVWIIPGVQCPSPGGSPDLMRGEETQVMGFPQRLIAGTHRVCLPGTHCKWVTLTDGRVETISTTMVGEVHALLKQHSILAESLTAAAGTFSERAFDAGVGRSGAAGGLLHHLFSVRVMDLLGTLPRSELPSFLSGLLIGDEIRHQVRALEGEATAAIHIVGSELLQARYERAFHQLGISAVRHPETLFATGAWRIAREAGVPG